MTILIRRCSPPIRIGSARRRRQHYNVFEGNACRGLARATPSGGRYVARDPTPAVHVANVTWREVNAPRGVARADIAP